MMERDIVCDKGTEAAEILTVRQVSKAFPFHNTPNAFKALDNISFSVKDKEIVSLIGPSGCGKSTLLAIIGGFEQPTTGEVCFRKQPIEGPSRDRGFVFQDDALFHWLTVEENVGYGLKVQRFPRPARLEIVQHSLQLVGLTQFRNSKPRQLSGGMRQRVAIARALATDPKILLLDEPFGALDVLTRKTMQRELARICDQTRKTVIMVTHSIEEAILLSDRIFVMAKAPSTIRETLFVDLVRPRSPRDPTFRDLELHIADLVLGESQNNRGESG